MIHLGTAISAFSSMRRDDALRCLCRFRSFWNVARQCFIEGA